MFFQITNVKKTSLYQIIDLQMLPLIMKLLSFVNY